MKRYVTLFVGVMISLGALYFLLRGDVENLQETISEGRYGYILPAMVFYVLALVARGYRWRALLGYRTNAWHAFHIMNVGYMLNSLPLRVGELARSWLTTRLDPPIAFFTSLSSIVVERVLDLLAVIVMLGIALVVLPVPQEVSASGAVIGAVTLAMAVVLVFFAHRRAAAHWILEKAMRVLPFLKRFNVVQWMDHLLDGIEPLTSWRITAEAVAWTVVGWILSVVTGYVLLFVFFDEGSLSAMMITVVLLALAVAIPSVPGNLGTFEAAGVAGLWIAGMIASADAPDNAPGVAFSLLLHMLSLGGYVILGIVGLWFEQTSLGQVRQGMAHVGEESELQPIP